MLPTNHEKATSYATTNPDDDEVTTRVSLNRLWEQDDDQARGQDDQADQYGPRKST
jgi:hypothetical protein